MKGRLKVDGVVVLYNPDRNVLQNIDSYIRYLNKLYVIDNSERKDANLISELRRKYKNLFYVNNNGNKGIAQALNLGARLAIKNGANWLLTMDQDSRFIGDSVKKLIEVIENLGNEAIGIVAPLHRVTNGQLQMQNSIVEELTVMTSGNLVNLPAYQKVGGFREDYFIDYVDHEYCLRLRKNGFKILVVTSSILEHNLGTIRVYDFFGKKVEVTNHSSLRRYYITRNRLDVFRRYVTIYPSFCLKDFKSFIVEWIKILLFEKEKWEKQKFIIKGIKDFLSGDFGKYNE